MRYVVSDSLAMRAVELKRMSDPVDRIQIVACDVSVNQTSVGVDRNGQLVSTDTLPQTQLWESWIPSVNNSFPTFLQQV